MSLSKDDNISLSDDICRKVSEAKQLQANHIAQLESDRELHPPVGCPATPRGRSSVIMITGGTQESLDTKLCALEATLGPRTCGNKRWGKANAALYADLLEHGRRLQRCGVTLPRNKSLSVAACSHGLGEILRRHGCTSFSDAQIQNDSKIRRKIGNKMSRKFGRVADGVEFYPCKDQ